MNYRSKSTARLLLCILAVGFLVGVSSAKVLANGTETLGPPTGIAIVPGTGTVSGGTGLVTQPGTINVNVPFGATVKQVLLYWACRGAGDPNINVSVNGDPSSGVGGTQIGGNSAGASFRADITGLSASVGEGFNTFEVSGLNCGLANNGASVLVIFDQGVDAAYSGEAAVLDAFSNILGNSFDVIQGHAGPLPPEGGSDEETLLNVSLPGGLLTSGTVHAETTGAGNQSHSEATVENLVLANLLNIVSLSALAVSAEATAQCDADGNASVEGDSTIANLALSLLGIPVTLPVNLPPNTTLVNVDVLGNQIKIVANEQDTTGTGGDIGNITVTALHIIINVPLLGTGLDIKIATAHADIDCDIITPAQIPLQIKDGFDFAFKNSSTSQQKNTVQQTFKFAPATFDRTANLTLFIGDCDANRPDRINIRIRNKAGTLLRNTNLDNRCRSSDGLYWDTLNIPVEIPAGANRVSVRLLSTKTSLTTAPDSLVWVLAAISGPSAQDITFSGRATVLRASVLKTLINAVLGDTGPLPPSGGTLEAPGINLNVPLLGLTSGTANAKTTGAGNQSNSEATVENLALGNLLNLVSASADVLSAQATAECDVNGNAQVSGSSVITNLALTVAGSPVNIPINFAPNTVLINLNVAGVIVRVVANEQLASEAGAAGEITVNALHISIGQPGDLGSIADIAIASAHADIACP